MVNDLRFLEEQGVKSSLLLGFFLSNIEQPVKLFHDFDVAFFLSGYSNFFLMHNITQKLQN